MSKQINPEIPGIREDSLVAIVESYPNREEAETNITGHLMKLQTLRGEEQVNQYEADIKAAGAYITGVYLDNILPEMNIEWGTYRSHLGHPYPESDYGEIEFGCWRCHNEETVNKNGDNISQECDMCHDYE